MAISNATLDTDVWNTVRSTLNSASIAIVNTATSTTTNASIAAAFNDREPSRPLLVINPIEMSEDGFRFGGKYGGRLISCTVDCYGKTSADVDSLSGQVQEAIRDWSEVDVSLVAVQVDVGFINPNEAKYHLKSVTFTFDKEL